jgi:hypothetical protein
MGLLSRLKHRIFRRLGDDAQALVDTAVLAMKSGRAVRDIEIETALGLLLRMPWFRGVKPAQLRGYLRDATKKVSATDLPRLAATFEDEPDAREVQIGISAYVLMCDRTMEPSERAWLDDLAARLSVSQDRVEELLADIAEHMAQDAAAP